MIVIFAGSQPDEAGRTSPRLPPEAEESLSIRIRGLLQSLEPRIVVGALAAGSDIIFAESARLENRAVRLLLPFDVNTFRSTSVEPHGQRWLARYDRLVTEVGAGVESLNLAVHEDSYTQHNAAMLDFAQSLAEPEERVWCITVRPTPDGSPESVTDDMVSRAAGRGLLTLDINPLASRPSAFVAMAYGKKFDPVSKRNIDCDVVFHRIYRPVLEDLDLKWNRADLETDSGIIHVGMLDDLANSDVVVADLTSINFNVAYEIGIRHVLARRSTVLVYPKVSGLRISGPPFDVAMSRVHSYDRGMTLTDQEAEAAIRMLRPVLTTAIEDGGADSPFHEWFSADAILRPFQRRSDAGQSHGAEIDARSAVREALKSSSAEPMLAAADHVAQATLDEPVRRALRIELAVGLIGELEHGRALDLLEVAQPPVDDPLHRLWLHSSVMALRHIGEHSPSSSTRDEILDRAESLLRQALALGYSDSESYGIWGGMLKRRLLREDLVRDEAADATFRLMEEYYELGFRSDPQAYTGVNLVMALRMRGNRNDLTVEETRRLNEALVVSRFLNRLDVERDGADLWASITEAELLLHAYFIEGAPLSEAVDAYARASAVATPQVRKSAADQIRFMKAWGDRASVLGPILALLDPRA